MHPTIDCANGSLSWSKNGTRGYCASDKLNDPNIVPYCGFEGQLLNLLHSPVANVFADRWPQLSPGIWVGGCLPNGTSPHGWTQLLLKDFLEFLDTLNIKQITVWCDAAMPCPMVDKHCPWMYSELRVWKSRGTYQPQPARFTLSTDDHAALVAVPADPVKLIIDTDIGGGGCNDVDDVVAVCIANALTDNGDAELLAIVQNTAPLQCAGAISVLNHFYGRSSLPIGAYDTATPNATLEQQPPLSYVTDLVDRFESPVKNSTQVGNAVAVYRRVLAAQIDRSVAISSIGIHTNLAALLKSQADVHSPLTGRELVAKKVFVLAVMGGHYPDSGGNCNLMGGRHPSSDGSMHNHLTGSAASSYVASHWPSTSKIIWSGTEVGSRVQSGGGGFQRCEVASTSNPCAAAMINYEHGPNKSRFSWDPLTTLVAVRGAAAAGTEECTDCHGYNEIDPGSGLNTWVTVPATNVTNQTYLVLRDDGSTAGRAIDTLLCQPSKLNPNPSRPLPIVHNWTVVLDWNAIHASSVWGRHIDVKTQEACAELCQSFANCTQWTWNYGHKPILYCFLSTSRTWGGDVSGHITSGCLESAVQGCGTPPPLPSGPRPHWAVHGAPNKSKALCGFTMAAGLVTTTVYRATEAIGMYNHAAMMDYHEGNFLLTWKNSPRDEDTPGQRILFSQSADGVVWTATDGTNYELFPNMSSASKPAWCNAEHHCSALFGGPTVILNGHRYASASPHQFALWPYPYASSLTSAEDTNVLLLRRVSGHIPAKLGPVFWASSKIPAGFEEASQRNGVKTSVEMDPSTLSDLAVLANASALPCATGAAAETLKCEACVGSCGNTTRCERTHYHLPDGRGEIILERGFPNSGHRGRFHFTFSKRSLGSEWTPDALTDIPDVDANLNAGVLPDGRIFLASNACPENGQGNGRDPLTVATSADGFAFDYAVAVMSCEALHQCGPRVPGRSKGHGPSYAQGVTVTGGENKAAAGLYVVATNNKEDVVVSFVPFTSLRPSLPRAKSDDDADKQPCADITLFGAIPDDGKCDTAAIQKALDYCVSMGGAVCVPRGTYTIKLPSSPNVTDTCLVIPSHCTLRGEGAAVSTLKFGPEINKEGWWRMIGAATDKQKSGTGDKGDTGSAANITIHDLGLHGNTNHTAYPYKQTSGPCFVPGPRGPMSVCEHNSLVFFYTQPPGTIKGVTVRNVRVEAIAGDCMVFANGVQDVLVEDIHLRDYIRQGVGLGGNALARNHTVRRVTELPWRIVTGPGGSTVHVEDATGLRDVIIEDCIMNHSLAASTVIKMTIRGNVIHGNLEANSNTQLRVLNNTIIATEKLNNSTRSRTMAMILAAKGAIFQGNRMLSAAFPNTTGLYFWGMDEGYNASSEITIAANLFIGEFSLRKGVAWGSGAKVIDLYGVRNVMVRENSFIGSQSGHGSVQNTCACCTVAPSKKAALCVNVSIKSDDASAAPSTAAALGATADMPLLFVDAAVLASASDGLQLQVHPPSHGPRILWPTEPWESFAVYASNSVVQLRPGDANYSAETSIRMYYDCVEIGTKTHWGQIGSDRACVAVSADGVTWSKPRLDIVRYQGQPSNIVGNCVSPAVFIDCKPGVPESQRWKMLCSNTVWAGPDGWHFEPMFGAGHKSIQHKDDTMDIGSYVSALNRYVIFVRRDIPVPGKTPSVHRRIGRCETDDLSNWEKFAPSTGCEIVFGPDSLDPDMVDIYTSSWTRYAGIEWFFPTFYHQFPNSNLSSPYGFPNDGLLNIRLAVSRSTTNLSYVATGAGAGASSPGFRAPFVAWGVNTCGEWAVHPSLPGGWCDAKNGVLATTSVDTSGGYMVAGSVDSSDELEVLTYASAQPFTHGGDIANVTWKNNTGIRLLRSRKHGWVSIDAGP
jgi:hypothetical protein